MKIDPRRLQILLAVARTGGVLAAADELGVSPSGVSQQLSKLEHEVGHALVRRTPRGTVLTTAGLAFAQAAEEIERALQAARARVDAGTTLEGRLTIGGITSFLATVVIPRLADWRVRFPNLQVQVVEDDPPSLMRLLRRGDLDAVIAELDSADDEQSGLSAGMSEVPLLDEPWRLVVPAGSLRTAEGVDLGRLPVPWLGVEASAASAAAVGRLRRTSGVQVDSVHLYQEVVTALALVAAGEGAAVVPLLALHGVVQDGVDVLDVPGLGTRRIVLRRAARGRPVNAPLDTVVLLLQEAVAALDLDGLVSR